MPSQPIVDFDTLDLSRPAFGMDEVRKFCKQRGRFEMLDGVLLFAPEQSLCIGFKDVRADDWWATDHIPGRPIFPGALQCEAAAQLSTFDYLKRRPDAAHVFLGFAGLDSVRFRGMVAPPSRLVIATRAIKSRSSMFIYEAQGFVGRQMVFEGQILGTVV
ncbi:MAG: beta-hydroxyacyl-ACP dehydratase [Planctomycetes bacterium]|nr:beta-hydroxyacyl-ACP dehydratase [Planctomycetota bacterium]